MKKFVLLLAALLAVITFLSSLRLLVIEATIPHALRWDGLRLFQPNRMAGDMRSLVEPAAIRKWVADKDMLHRDYVICAARRREADTSGDWEARKRQRENCLELLKAAVQYAPSDGRLWLEIAIATVAARGRTSDAMDALRASFKTAPREGWIAKVRHEFVVGIWQSLPDDLRISATEDVLNSWQQVVLSDLLFSGSPRDVQRAVIMLEGSGEDGNIYALERLGHLYLAGERVPADPGRGRKYLEQAIAAGSTTAMVKLGEALVRGSHGLEVDRTKGAQLLERAARTDQWGQLVLSNMLLSSKLPRDAPRAIALLQESAESGNSYALEKLGQIYLTGTIVAADSQKGRKYLERAIIAGSVGAKAKLGEALIKGKEVPKDLAAGLRLLESAAVTDQWAQLFLGTMLISGELPRDVPRGIALLEASAQSGNPNALEKLGQIYSTGEGGVAANTLKGREYLRRANQARSSE